MTTGAGVSLYPGLPTTTLQLSLSAKGLPKKDTLSKSDPVCILYVKSKDEWIEAGRTEKIDNNPDPVWKTKFNVNFSFEERQWIKFDVYDWDKGEVAKAKLADQDILGSCECLLAQIVSTPGKTFVASLLSGGDKEATKNKDKKEKKSKSKLFKFFSKKKKSGPELHVIAEEAATQKETIEIQFGANNLDKKDVIGKSDPYFTLSRQSDGGDFVKIFKSEVISNNLNPVWKKLVITTSELCAGDFNRKIKMEVFDHDDMSSHDVIGELTLTVAQLQNAVPTTTQFDVINLSKVGKKNYNNSGKVYLKHFKVNSQDHTFFDYIRGGTKMQFTVGVDFTASNGKVTDPTSLHYRSAGGDNAYTMAIKAVGEVIENYDADKLFPALGFGARVPPNSYLSHEFFLNMKTDSPLCSGTQGILDAYDKARNSVTLYGPTCFAPIINHVAKLAADHQSNASQYFVLLILTDGAITDFDETRSAIVAASNLPMSIIIVGVGNENFQTMEYFDGDKSGPIKDSQGNKSARDIVQFVEMKKFMVSNGAYDRDRLCKEILAEVPHQMVGYMVSRGFKPLHY